jgi:hypothetical protein
MTFLGTALAQKNKPETQRRIDRTPAAAVAERARLFAIKRRNVTILVPFNFDTPPERRPAEAGRLED